MSATLAIYRLPTIRAAPIGHVRVVMDRNHQIYIQGSRLTATAPSSDFLILKLANEQDYYVKAADYQRVHTSLLAKTTNRNKPTQRSKR